MRRALGTFSSDHRITRSPDHPITGSRDSLLFPCRFCLALLHVVFRAQELCEGSGYVLATHIPSPHFVVQLPGERRAMEVVIGKRAKGFVVRAEAFENRALRLISMEHL